MRRSAFDSARSATVVLLVLNVAAFIAEWIASSVFNFQVGDYFALSLKGLGKGFVWQVLTFQFLHGGLVHLFFNCWALYVFGREVEQTLGLKRFLALYFSSGIAGGLLQIIAGLALEGRFATAVVGASAGVFGLVAAFAMLYPERQLMLLVFFIIPVRMRAKFLLLFSGLLALFGVLVGGGNVAHAAHLGGMLAGIGYVRYAMHWNWRWPSLGNLVRRQKRPPIRMRSEKPGWSGSSREDDLPPDEFLAREVDPILDKISAHGIQSLTERERRILEAARSRMAKR
jgi:membrane associated rhomboid family serine protease